MLMKNFLLIALITIAFIDCKKNDSGCTPVSPASEATMMANFCVTNGINATVDSNGIYYEVIIAGSGVKPNLNSLITVTYTASTLDGEIVENKSSTPVTEYLNRFIDGWQLALPYIQKGGRIKMVVPSVLAYGCTGVKNLIAPNSPLYYDIVLTDVE